MTRVEADLKKAGLLDEGMALTTNSRFNQVALGSAAPRDWIL